MNEKQYKVMSQTGASGIVLGIIALVVGVSVGVLSIINGSRLLHGKKNITF